MNIDTIRSNIESHIGDDILIKYNLGRNKIEKYNAMIKELYNYIFIVEIKNSSELKSFMYSDIITNTIRIDYK